VKFSNEIQSISPSFVKIYNESHFAEEHKLLEICGVGYRKALEFLVKDYLIKKNPEKAESIKKKFLGKCIQEDVTDSNIKTVSQRAVWLGNDETHYVREWTEENLDSLKKLISLTNHWIEMEVLTDDFAQKMPDKK
jgi:hemerythrin